MLGRIEVNFILLSLTRSLYSRFTFSPILLQAFRVSLKAE